MLPARKKCSGMVSNLRDTRQGRPTPCVHCSLHCCFLHFVQGVKSMVAHEGKISMPSMGVCKTNLQTSSMRRNNVHQCPTKKDPKILCIENLLSVSLVGVCFLRLVDSTFRSVQTPCHKEDQIWFTHSPIKTSSVDWCPQVVNWSNPCGPVHVSVLFFFLLLLVSPSWCLAPGICTATKSFHSARRFHHIPSLEAALHVKFLFVVVHKFHKPWVPAPKSLGHLATSKKGCHAISSPNLAFPAP